MGGMTDEELEDWQAARISAIRFRLHQKFDVNPDAFWREIDATIAHIVMATVAADDMDWPESLHLSDIIEKHIIKALGE